MKRLTPFTNQLPFSSWYADVFTLWRSDPASGSVSTIAPVYVPLQSFGTYSALISSLANWFIVSAIP